MVKESQAKIDEAKNEREMANVVAYGVVFPIFLIFYRMFISRTPRF